ncbi:MAG: hypothetical protein HOM27_02095 [Candidatus Marinimicrobia bacterium]|nr:hypothetical protein [Candidatus Neomarinimicrobiota bacterium]MBT5114843.1 hypothetical protein [Candidatus Neomarinimicrobiota bacterium]MBT6796629.1 hypothetical protein [Candidatus Neomarinimicrobiota bacterium]
MQFNRILLLSAIIMAEEIPISTTGIIVCQNESVAFATILNNRTKLWEISNENGIFLIPQNTQNGDTLWISRIGFETLSIESSQTPSIIELNRSPIHFPEIQVQSKTSNQHILPNSGSSRQEVISGLSGTILRTYGGNSGIALAAMDGGRTVDLKVLFDEIDLTNPQNGMSDLSQLPNLFLGFAEINENLFLNNGTGSTDGVMHLNPWSHPPGVQLQTGLDGTQYFSGQISNSWEDYSLSATIGKNTDPGTHPVLYNSELIERKNQQFDQYFSGFHIEIKKNQWLSKLSLWNSIQERGISGLIWSPNIEANRKDTLALFSGSLIRIFPKGFLKSSLTYKKSGENYFDPTFAINSNHLSKSISNKVSGFYQLNSKLIYRFNAGFAIEDVSSTDVGNHQRNRNYFSSSMSLSHFVGFKFLSAMRLDNYSDFGTAFTFSDKLSRNIFSWLSISGAMGSSFRAPTFNDLYWNPGGNPKLNPEESYYSKVSTQATFSNSSFELSIKNTDSKNLIVWKSTGDFWQPVNVNESTRRIVGINGQVFLSKKLIIQGSIRYIQSEDLSTENQLRHSPNWIGNTKFGWKGSGWETDFSMHYTGSQIVMYDYPNNVSLNKNISTHFSLGILPILQNQIHINLSISNLLNKELMTIYGYPEASRNFKINISYQLNKKVKNE